VPASEGWTYQLGTEGTIQKLGPLKSIVETMIKTLGDKGDILLSTPAHVWVASPVADVSFEFYGQPATGTLTPYVSLMRINSTILSKKMSAFEGAIAELQTKSAEPKSLSDVQSAITEIENIRSETGEDRFENVRLDPVVITDCAGKRHEFHFQLRLLGSMVALDAFEVKAGAPKGYQSKYLRSRTTSHWSLLGRLIERMRRSLSVQYLARSELGAQIADQAVCGRIGWNERQHGRVPLLVIDGRAVSWDELGRMVMSSEGSQFRLKIRDRSEEV
jgi:hypothetical protein